MLSGADSLIGVKFWKVQSIGNDFVVYHPSDLAAIPEADWVKLIPRLCDRRFGVGSDGVLIIGQAPDGLTMRMFNPDGTEDFCGNGLRCAAVHGSGQGWVTDKFNILHGGQSIPTEILENGNVRTTIGPATYDPEKVPVSSTRELFQVSIWSGMDAGHPMNLFGSALTTGSTHVVLPLFSLPDEATFQSISPKIETDGRFPKHTSVIWVQEVEPMRIKIRIWERGACETLGCGTGSAAAAADYLRRKSTGGSVTVENPGGTVVATMAAWDAPIQVDGPARELFSGVWAG